MTDAHTPRVLSDADSAADLAGLPRPSAQIAKIMALVERYSFLREHGTSAEYDKAGSAVEAALRDAPQQAEPLFAAMLASAPTPEPMSAPTAEPSDAERLWFERDPFERAIDSFLEDYEMIGETEAGHGACYTPNENDKALIKDAIMGLLADSEWDRLWGEHIDAAIHATKGGKL